MERFSFFIFVLCSTLAWVACEDEYEFKEYLTEYTTVKKTKFFLFLDFDGTLAAFHTNPKETAMSPQMRDVLTRLARRSEVIGIIVTGRTVPDVKPRIGFDHFTYAGEYGLVIEAPVSKQYSLVFPKRGECVEKTDALQDELQNICTGQARIRRNDDITLTCYYDEVQSENSKKEIRDAAKAVVEKHGFTAYFHDDNSLNARNPSFWNKAEAVKYILENELGNWAQEVGKQRNVGALYIGDEPSDEAAITALKNVAVTFRVDHKNFPNAETNAGRRLENPDAVRAVLEWLDGYFDSYTFGASH